MAEFMKEKAKEQMLEELIAFEGGVRPALGLRYACRQSRELTPYAFIEFEKGWSNRHLFQNALFVASGAVAGIGCR